MYTNASNCQVGPAAVDRLSRGEGSAMNNAVCTREPLFRVWIAGCTNWVPVRWDDVPPSASAVALAPAEEGCLSAEMAREYLKGFNDPQLAQAKTLWAVALPIVLRYDGDAEAGQCVAGHRFASDAPSGPPSSGPPSSGGLSAKGVAAEPFSADAASNVEQARSPGSSY
jgi:hypothetical protein